MRLAASCSRYKFCSNLATTTCSKNDDQSGTMRRRRRSATSPGAIPPRRQKRGASRCGHHRKERPCFNAAYLRLKMDLLPPGIRNLQAPGAVDARAIVRVKDPYGGLTVYYRGRPISYLMAGEWYPAFPVPSGRGDNSAPSAATRCTESVRADSVDAAEVLDYDEVL